MYKQIESNKHRTIVIMVLFILFIVTLAYVFGKAMGYSGFGLAGMFLIISGLMSLFSYYFSDKIILGMSGAHEIQREDNFTFFTTVENLCIGSGLPMPRIYIIDDSAPNAFATGRDPNHSIVCVTTGLLDKLSKVELEGVIAHELSHVKNYDIRLMSIVVILVGVITLLADFFLRGFRFSRNNREGGGSVQGIFMLAGIILAVLSPLVAALIQLSISREREYLADVSGALLTRYPEGLATALEKISADREPLEAANNATAHLYMVNPFKGKKITSWVSGLFDTHPPIEERIKRLRSM